MVLPLIPYYPMSEEQVYEFRTKQLHETVDKIAILLKNESHRIAALYYHIDGSISNASTDNIFLDYKNVFDPMRDENEKKEKLFNIILHALIMWNQLDDKKNVFKEQKWESKFSKIIP